MNTCRTIQLLDETEVSEAIKRSIHTLRNDRFKGTGLPYVKIGRSVRYRIADVEKFVLKNLVSTDNG